MAAPTEATSGAGAGNTTALGKRKKVRGKNSLLGSWLERAARHTQDDLDYEYIPHSPYNVDPCRLNSYFAPEPVSLPTYPFYSPSQYPQQYWPQDCRYVQSAHKSIQVQRPRIKRQTNGVNNVFNGYLQPKHEDNEYASLPPIVTSVGDTASNSEANDKESGSARRFSDPCLPPLPPERAGSASDEADGDGSVCNATNSKLLMCLVDQINALKVANERLNKDLQETRAELQSVRQQAALWQKGSMSSLGPSNYNPLSNNGYLSSPQYTPGALSDLVREIRDAARLREEALYARVRCMVDERTLNQSGLSSDKSAESRNYEEIRSELRAVEADKRRMSERLARLEGELRHLRSGGGNSSGSSAADAEDAEAVRLRRELQDARRELQDARRAKLQADDNTLRLERLVTQMRSCKVNGLSVTSPGPASIASEAEGGDPPGAGGARVRRTSSASTSSPHTIVLGPVTDL